MGRWEPGAKERLHAAALDLFLRQGFEQTTTAQIAGQVGLTERTFFRHFADKREVLFGGQEQFLETFLAGAVAAPPDASAMEAVAATLETAAEFFPEERRAHSRRRQQVITAYAALREREQLKLTGLGEALAATLRDRGTPDPEAALAAQLGVTVFAVSFEQWLAADEERPLAEIQRESMVRLRALAAPPTRT